MARPRRFRRHGAVRLTKDLRVRPDNLHGDFPEFPLPNPPLPAGAGREAVSFAIDPAATAVPATARPEPSFGPALLVEFEEPERLDPDRATGLPEAPPSPETRRATSPLGLAGSIGVHLLPLLVLFTWHGAPPDAAAPIPVQLVVLEEPKPPPPQPPPPAAKEAKPPPGRLASVDIGEPAGKPDQSADSQE